MLVYVYWKVFGASQYWCRRYQKYCFATYFTEDFLEKHGFILMRWHVGYINVWNVKLTIYLANCGTLNSWCVCLLFKGIFKVTGPIPVDFWFQIKLSFYSKVFLLTVVSNNNVVTRGCVECWYKNEATHNINHIKMKI